MSPVADKATFGSRPTETCMLHAGQKEKARLLPSWAPRSGAPEARLSRARGGHEAGASRAEVALSCTSTYGFVPNQPNGIIGRGGLAVNGLKGHVWSSVFGGTARLVGVGLLADPSCGGTLGRADREIGPYAIVRDRHPSAKNGAPAGSGVTAKRRDCLGRGLPLASQALAPCSKTKCPCPLTIPGI